MCLILSMFLFVAARAQVPMDTSRTTYTQNFDALPVSGVEVWESGSEYIPGWSVHRSKAASTLTANYGNSNGGGLYNYGSIGSSDRSLGSISSLNAGEFTYTLLLQNTTDRAIQAVDLSYVGEQWRTSNSTAGQHIVSFYYAISSSKNGFKPGPKATEGWVEVPEMKFYGPKYFMAGGPHNGNLPENRQLLQTSLPLDIPAGYYLMLRWKDADDLEADHGLAIDDVSITWHLEPEAPIVPLPVELVYFKASTKGEQVELRWQTASEENNSHFVAERSADGFAFENIGKVAGKGNSVQLSNYAFVDQMPLPGTSYYRLKQVDVDGSYTYSSVVSLQRLVAQKLSIYPTVATQELHVSGPVKLQQMFVIDQMGRQVLDQKLDGNPLQHTLDVRNLRHGTYVLVLLDAEGNRHTSRFLKR